APEAIAAPEGVLDKVRARIAADARADEAARELAPRVTVLRACTYCHGAIGKAEVVYCATCLAQHHRDCFSEHGGCGAPGCGEKRVLEPRELPARRSRRGLVIAL